MALHTKTILFPTDFSELSLGAIPWVRKLSDDWHAQVHCLHVVQEPRLYGTLDMSGVDAIPTADEIARDSISRLETFVAEHLSGLKYDPVTEIVIGAPFVEIVRYARRVDAALIVMTTHGYTGLKHVLLGSTTEAVLRKAECPVLSVRSADMQFEMP